MTLLYKKTNVTLEASCSLLNFGRLHFNRGPTMRADEDKNLLHSTKVWVPRSAMRARYLGTGDGRNKDLALRPVPDLDRKFLGIGRIRIEMSDGLLQPRKDVGHQGHSGFGYEAVHAVAEPDLNPSHSLEISTLISLS